MRRAVLLAAVAAACAVTAPGRLLQAQEPGEGPQVDSVAVMGNRRITTETIINAASLPLRTPITFRDIQRAIRAVHGLGHFDDVQVGRAEGPAGEEVLVIAVRERPILTRVAIRGVAQVSERSVRDQVTDLVITRPLDPAALAASRQRVDSLYEAQGYYLAEVRPEIIPEDSGTVRVLFAITENRRVAIAAVQVEGNRVFPDGAVVGKLKTKPEGFWWFQGGEYSETELREDIERRLPAFYGSRGFLDFRVVRDTLIVDPTTGKATVLIEVDEGRPYLVGRVTVEGNRYFTTPQILSLNPFASAGNSGIQCLFRRCADSATTWFDQEAWEEATNKLRTQYANEGYIYADVRPEIERVEPAAGDSIALVNLSWTINEQRPAIINRIEIRGNEVTHERIIREAIVILPGDVFSQDRIIRSYQNISNLGFFQQPLPFPDTRPANEEGDIDVIFRVQEKQTGSVNFGASVGQGVGVGGFLGLEEPNLFGQGKRGRLQWQFGRNINDFNLSYTDPQLWGSRVSGTVELHNSRVRYTVADLGRIYNQGFSFQFGLPLPRSRYSRLFLTTSIDRESYSGGASTISQQTLACRNGCLRTMLGASVVRDTRIDLPFPTGGSYHSVGLNLNGPLGTGSARFQRVDLEGRWYAPVGRIGGGPTMGGIKMVLGLSARSGFVFGDPGPFFRQLYAMGGTQYGLPLRGYDEFSVTPQGYNPAASLGGVPRNAFGQSFFLMTSEFGVRFSQQFYMAAFYDAGNVWASAAGFNPSRLFRGAGLGVSLITPLGPIGLDYAYGFDKVNLAGQNAAGWKFHFRIGNFF